MIIHDAFGEKAVLKPMLGAAQRWLAICVSELEGFQVRAIRDELQHEYKVDGERNLVALAYNC